MRLINVQEPVVSKFVETQQRNYYQTKLNKQISVNKSERSPTTVRACGRYYPSEPLCIMRSSEISLSNIRGRIA